MRPGLRRRFEALVSLNLEGISSEREDRVLWRLLKSQDALKEEFLEARETHYLLKVHLDEALSAAGFVNGIINAMHPHRLNDKDFTAAVLGRMNRTRPVKRTWVARSPIWRVAASIIIAIGCAMGMVYHLQNPELRYPGVPRESNRPLAWHYAPQTQPAERKLAFYETPAHRRPPGYPHASDPLSAGVQQINTRMKRIETSLYRADPIYLKDIEGEP